VSKLLILRPQPGADATAERARALGLEPIVAPLFTVRALDWEAPGAGDFDAILLTSANAARLGGARLTGFTHLPCYAVGEATEDAARAAGFDDVMAGPSDGAALIETMADVRRLLHLCGRDHAALDRPGLSRRIVYASDPVPSLPPQADLTALVLLHSPRAAAHFAALAGPRAEIRLAALSEAVAQAAGAGWKSVAVAAHPRDEALLELAAKLCQTEREAR